MGHIWISYVFDMGHYPPYQTHMMPCSGSLLSYLWESYVFRKVPYNSQIWEWYGLWEWYGMIAMQRNDMGMVWEVQSVPYLTHIYGKDMYLVKIHSIPIHGNDMGWEWYGMIAIAREWYGNVYQSHTKPTSMGKIHPLFLLGEIKVWGNSPIPIPKLFKEMTTLWLSFKVLLFKSWTR